MAKSKMAEEAAAENEAKRQEAMAARTYMLKDTAWDDGDGEEFGGKSQILLLDENEIGGPFTYIGHQKMTTELGETTVHMATGPDGETYRLPIQATFLRSIDQADMGRGDKFIVRRFPDELKKRGKGAGEPMSIYGLRVKERAPRAPVPASA